MTTWIRASLALSFAPLLAHAAALAPAPSPLAWSDVATGDRLVLTEPLELAHLSLPGRFARLDAGAELTIDEADALEMIGVFRLAGAFATCPDRAFESEMTLVTAEGATSAQAVGVTLLPGCRFEIFVENRDLGIAGFLARP